MSVDILMPALSPTMEEGTLSKWLKKEGDAVKSGDIIAEIETDKATMEVEAVDEGTVTELLVAEGAQGVKVKVGKFPWTASGRAIANGRDEGFTKLIFDEASHRVLGGGIVGTHAGDLIGEVALAVEMGADAVDIGRTIHPHPTLGESVGLAAEVAEGVCTDVPPPRR